ncbi:MAG: hypothetical protein A2Y73_06125 [Chloroflexi bacterium RBG_13_56_8]|nr:MAG: hypothetical protein A2Y73_06125 [Chloroflexi bacterium RBG_13_56_8]
MEIDSVRILGVRVHNVTTEETLGILERYVTEGRAHQVVTANPEFVIEAQRNAAFRVVLHEADLALPDGAGLLWASRLLGKRLRERVAGADLVPLIARLCAGHAYGMYLLGAAPGVAERAACVLVEANPGLRIVGTYAGSPDPDEEDETVARIMAAAPEFLLVAYGAPRQDLWIHRNLARLGVPVCMGVGGALDFVAGVTVRAPLWMRRVGLEWLHRLWRQPWRWRRMLALPRFVILVMGQRLSSAMGRN